MKFTNFYELHIKRKILFYILAPFLILLALMLFPLERLASNEEADSAASCPYYLSLESLLASYPLLASDPANAQYIKHNLLKFENRMSYPTLSAEVISKYKTPYYNELAKLNLSSIKHVKSADSIINIAHKTASTVDGFYLDKSVNCINTLYNWEGQTRRIIRFNLNGLYDQIPDKYSRILMAIQTDWITGSSPGFFILNQTETLDTRFGTGLPLLTALYVLPKDDFSKAGNYSSFGNWRYFNTDMLLDPLTRKVLDVGGIDVMTVTKADLHDRVLPDTHILPTNINPLFGDKIISLLNSNSYGIAYIANQITYENPQKIRQDEKRVIKYFKDHKDVAGFLTITTNFYDKIMQLKSKYDVILESPASLPELEGSSNDQVRGTAHIKGIVAQRAFFDTNCRQKNCLFVFNMGFSPGWHAFVNGSESPILRVNYAFMSTEVPQGESTIWFIYNSLPQLLSYLVSIITLLMIVTFSIARLSHQSNP